MLTLNEALSTAQKRSTDWEIHSTASGGWQLRLISGGGALINLMMFPCDRNLGEVGKPYQAHCNGIQNFTTLAEALDFVYAQA